jgi:hypothetical protein
MMIRISFPSLATRICYHRPPSVVSGSRRRHRRFCLCSPIILECFQSRPVFYLDIIIILKMTFPKSTAFLNSSNNHPDLAVVPVSRHRKSIR